MAGGQWFMSQTLLFDRGAAMGRLRFTDQHRLDLLNRMSTNNTNALAVGQGCTTVLVTALARIIDRLTVYNQGETVLVLSGLPTVVRGWLQRHIFWQDRLKIEDVSAQLAHYELHGPQAEALLAGLLPPDADLAKLPLHHFYSLPETAANGLGGLLVARSFPLAASGFTLILPNDQAPALQAALACPEADNPAYESLRISAGLPAAGHELTEDYIPLEAGLWDSVSFNKGCYIGQEIIARMESRNKLAKQLVALHSTQPPQDLSVGLALSNAEGNTVGTLTSFVPQAEGWRGLAYVKTDFAAVGGRLRAGDLWAEVVTAPLLTRANA
jgi:tRNA-modifying protein YgfZ